MYILSPSPNLKIFELEEPIITTVNISTSSTVKFSKVRYKSFSQLRPRFLANNTGVSDDLFFNKISLAVFNNVFLLVDTGL